MQASTPSAAPRLHPLAVAAAASVTLVSLVGAAAILGWLPASQTNALQTSPVAAPAQQAPDFAQAAANFPAPLAAAMPTRFETADGRVFEEVGAPAARPAVAAAEPVEAPVVRTPAAPVRHKVVHHPVAQHAAPDQPSPPRATEQQVYAQQHPVQSYVSDMHPVGTGIGAVIGGALGHQVGGGNGKKLATVAGVLLGGYAGNEVAHDRNPLPLGNP